MSGAGLGLDRDSSVCLGEREGGISVTQLPLQKSGGFDLVAMAVMTSLFPLMVLDLVYSKSRDCQRLSEP